MADYFWSARFFCGGITLALGVAWLTGGLLYLAHGGGRADTYYPAVGAALCVDGVLLGLVSRTGLGLFGLILLGALGWTLFDTGLDVWALLPRLLALLLWALTLFALRHRIAPSRDPAGSPAARVRALLLQVGAAVREHSRGVP